MLRAAKPAWPLRPGTRRQAHLCSWQGRGCCRWCPLVLVDNTGLPRAHHRVHSTVGDSTAGTHSRTCRKERSKQQVLLAHPRGYRHCRGSKGLQEACSEHRSCAWDCHAPVITDPISPDIIPPPDDGAYCAGGAEEAAIRKGQASITLGRYRGSIQRSEALLACLGGANPVPAASTAPDAHHEVLEVERKAWAQS